MKMTGRQADLSPDEAVAYAPVAPLAVAAIGITSLSALVIAGMWLAARQTSKPNFQPALLLAPLVGLILACIAFRQVRAADGTKSGRGMATVAFWLALLTILIYGTYLFTIDLVIRNQASQFTMGWLAKAATEPLESSFVLCLEPATRASMDEKDIKGLHERFSSELAAYGNNDLYRMIRRGGTNYEAHLKGVREWGLADGGYAVSQIFEYRSPEGKFDLLLGTFGRDTPALGGRTWQVVIRKCDLAARETTVLGRLILDLQVEARKNIFDWGNMFNSGQMHDVFIESLPLAQRDAFRNRRDSAEEKQFLSGSLILVDGKGPTDEQRKKYANLLAVNVSPGSVTHRVGAPMIEFLPDAVRLRHHIEIKVADVEDPVVAYVDTIVQGDELVAELLRLGNDKDWQKQPTEQDRPGVLEIDRFPKRGYRTVAIDVKPTEKRLSGSPGPGGGPQR